MTDAPTTKPQSPKPLVVVPAYNEAESIVAVIEGLAAACPQYDFIIVNDGSSDATAKLCREHGFPLLDLAVNLGLSGAVGAGMRYAFANGYNIVLQFDSDGQHRPEFIPALVEKSAQGFDVVCGSRFVSARKPASLRMLGSRLIASAVRLTTGVRLSDPTSGMRAYSARVVELFASQINMTPELDTLSYLAKTGMRIAEVEVEMNQRLAGKSYLGAVTSIKYMLRMFISILIFQLFRQEKAS